MATTPCDLITSSIADEIWRACAWHTADRSSMIQAMEDDPASRNVSSARLPDGPVILFDAECVLCSANAHFILKHDKGARFHLASMQGEVGSMLFREHGVDPADPSTIIVVDGVNVRKNSDAVLCIYEALGFPWRFASLFRLIPGRLRDPIYAWIARNRYWIFGKRPTCWIPPEEFRSRVL
ncbi:thiol-disulfide oxidoreductase DCC family protein [Sphingobium fluviale]|nr:DCC1-like thiol-disulfide oxidoreductase family protein [Sphingobium fluviale]